MPRFIRKYGLQLFCVAAIAAFALVIGLHHVPGAWAVPGLAMGIVFNSIPNNLRVPFVAVEISNANASLSASPLSYNLLLMGQKTSGGSGTANTIYPVTSAAQVQTLAGQGSMLHRMAMAYFASNTSTSTFIGILADNGSGVLATGTLVFTGPATAAGTVNLYVGGQYVPVAVNSGDASTAIATAAAAALSAAGNLGVTASVTSSTVTVTAKNKGTNGNAIDLRVNYQVGQAFPAGVGCTITGMASGATNPTLSGLIAAMGDQWFQVIANPYTDSTSLTAFEAELDSRFGPMRMIDGLGITSGAGSYSTLATLGEGRNDSHNCIVAQPVQSPLTPPEEFAAEVAGVVAYYGAIDSGRPFQTLPLTWTLPPQIGDHVFTTTERNLLLHDGIATTSVAPGDVVQLERIITTYQLNSSGSPDTSYLDATTMLNLMYLRYSFRTRIQNAFPRSKLAQDGTKAGPGQPIVTPSVGKAEAVAWFGDMMELGLVQDLDSFKANLDVEIDGTTPTQLNFLLPPTLISQLIVGAAQIQFELL